MQQKKKTKSNAYKQLLVTYIIYSLEFILYRCSKLTFVSMLHSQLRCAHMIAVTSCTRNSFIRCIFMLRAAHTFLQFLFFFFWFLFRSSVDHSFVFCALADVIDWFSLSCACANYTLLFYLFINFNWRRNRTK